MKSLRDLRIEHNLTLQQAADDMHMTAAALSLLERGLTKPRSKTISNLAAYYDLPVDQIRQMLSYAACHDGVMDTYNIGSTVQIPIIGQTAAGYGSLAASAWTGEYAALPADALHGGNPRDFFALHVRGNSMEPRIMDGDIAIIHKQSDVSSGDIALVVYGDDIDAVGTYGTLKQVKKNEDGSITLVALNPDYDTLTIGGIDLRSVRIQGRLTQILRAF